MVTTGGGHDIVGSPHGAGTQSRMATPAESTICPASGGSPSPISSSWTGASERRLTGGDVGAGPLGGGRLGHVLPVVGSGVHSRLEAAPPRADGEPVPSAHVSHFSQLLDQRPFTEDDVLRGLEVLRRRSQLTSAPFNRHILPMLARRHLREKWGPAAEPWAARLATHDGAPAASFMPEIRRLREERRRQRRQQRDHPIHHYAARATRAAEARLQPPSSPPPPPTGCAARGRRMVSEKILDGPTIGSTTPQHAAGTACSPSDASDATRCTTPNASAIENGTQQNQQWRWQVRYEDTRTPHRDRAPADNPPDSGAATPTTHTNVPASPGDASDVSCGMDGVLNDTSIIHGRRISWANVFSLCRRKRASALGGLVADGGSPSILARGVGCAGVVRQNGEWARLQRQVSGTCFAVSGVPFVDSPDMSTEVDQVEWHAKRVARMWRVHAWVQRGLRWQREERDA